MKAQVLQWKRVTSSQHDEPTHKEHLKPVCLAIARLRPNESTGLAMKETHLFPAWWANQQKTSETIVFGNSAASTYWKHSSCNEREPPLPNMMSQPTKKPLKPVCLAIVRLRPNESTALAMKESHLFPAWWANPQKISETSVFGHSAASTYWKHSSCNERESPLPNMMSQPTKNLWNQCVWH